MKLALFITLLLIFQFCSLQIAALSPKNSADLIGTFKAGIPEINESLTLELNGRYTKNILLDCEHSIRESGSYFSQNNVLHLTVEKYVLGAAGRFFDDAPKFDLLNSEELPKAIAEFGKGVDARKTVEDLKKTYQLRIVKWSERVYLITEKDLNRFVNLINLGIEPRQSLHDENSSFFLRAGDEKKKVSGKPALDGEFLPNILETPVEALIIGFENKGKERFITINKGSHDGLKTGMLLIRKTDAPYFLNFLTIVSVEDKTAKAVSSLENPAIGDEISTRAVINE